jgi:hypothetical protein
MLTFGGELMGEAVEMVVDDLNSHRFMSMRDIEASLQISSIAALVLRIAGCGMRWIWLSIALMGLILSWRI